MAKNHSNTKIWLTIFLFGLFLRLIYLLINHQTGYLVDTDGVAYLRLAEALLAGRGLVDDFGNPYYYHPPAYSFFILLFSLPLRSLLGGAITVSLLSGASLCIIAPLCLEKLIQLFPATSLEKLWQGSNSRFSMRTLLYPPYFLGLLLAVNPLLISFSTRVMADAFFSLTVWLGALFLLSYWQKKHLVYTLISFSILAASYLIKPEGLFFFVLFVAVQSLFILRNKPQFLCKVIPLALIAAIIFILPYAGWISSQKGKPTLSGKSNAWVQGFDEHGFSHFVELNYQLNPEGTRILPGKRVIKEKTQFPSVTQWLLRYSYNFWQLRNVLQDLLPYGLSWLSLLAVIFLFFKRYRPGWLPFWLLMLSPLTVLPFFFIVPRLLLSSLPAILFPLAYFPTILNGFLQKNRLLIFASAGYSILIFLLLTFVLHHSYTVPMSFWNTLHFLQDKTASNSIIVAGKPQLAFHSNNIHLPLPYSNEKRLIHYMVHNKAKIVILTSTDVNSRPQLKTLWQGKSTNFIEIAAFGDKKNQV